MHKLEINVVYISPNKLSGPGLTCGSWKTEVVHIYYFYFSEMAVPAGGSKANWQWFWFVLCH